MKSSAKNVKLASVGDLFSTEESRIDDAMLETAESVRQYGVLVPAIARHDPAGGYELVSGHRRHRASVMAGKDTMPVIVRELDDDAATIIMVDSNLQREELLPSERAFAYKMKLDAIKHQGMRGDLTSRQLGEKLQTSIQVVAEAAGESQRQVQRYIRLTELIPPLLDMNYLTEHNLLEYAALAEKTAAVERYNELSDQIKEAEKRLAEIAVLRTHIINYSKTRDVYAAYRKAGYSKRFLAEHEANILLHKAVKNAFDELGVKKLPTVKSLQTEYAQILEKKKKAYGEYKKARGEMQQLFTVKANVDQVLGIEKREAEKENEHGQRPTDRV